MERAMPIRCFACEKVIGDDGYIVGCKDEQTVSVGPECYRKVKAGQENGYQPPLGGPRLYLLQYRARQVAK